MKFQRDAANGRNKYRVGKLAYNGSGNISETANDGVLLLYAPLTESDTWPIKKCHFR